MTRRWFPDEGSRLGYSIEGSFFAHASGVTALVYTNAEATQPADILDGDGAPASSLTLDMYSRIPNFQGPADGTDTLYVTVGGGPAAAVYARPDDRLDDLDDRVATLEGEVVSGTPVVLSPDLPGASIVFTVDDQTDPAHPRLLDIGLRTGGS